MNFRTAALLLFVGASTITACSSETGADDAASTGPAANASVTVENAAAPAAMPPMVVRSPAYRCDDGRALYVDVLTDENAVNVRDSRADVPKLLAREGGTGPFSGPDRSLSGTGDVVRYAGPGRSEQECRLGES
ncbi:MAG: hypothetical protein ACXWUP_01575 [Allosphingosinicella sp.]